MAKRKPTARFNIAATGDIHVGLTIEDMDRSDEALGALECFVDWCIANKPTVAEIGGDIFDYNHPLSSHVAAVMRLLRRLDEAEIIVIVMMGNHDAIADLTQLWAGRPLEAAGYTNIRFATEPCILDLGANQWMMCLPHVSKAMAVHKGFRTPQEFLETWARQQLDKWKGMPLIVCAHMNVWCAKTGTEATMLRQSDLQLPAWLPDHEAVGIVINHHIHTPQNFGKVWLPGSPLCTDFGDVDENKSFMVASEQDGEWTVERVRTPQAPLQEFEIDCLNKDASQIANLLGQVRKTILPDAIVKLRVLIEEERLAEFEEEGAMNMLRPFCRYVKQIQKVPVRKRAVRDGRQSAGLAPVDAVELYLERANPKGAERKRELAMMFLRGEKPSITEPISITENEAQLDAAIENAEREEVADRVVRAATDAEDVIESRVVKTKTKSAVNYDVKVKKASAIDKIEVSLEV